MKNYQNYFESLDFSYVEKMIANLIGFTPKLITTLEKRRNGDQYIEIQSFDNLVKTSGIFASIFKNVQINTFSSSLNYDEENDRFGVWFTVNISWKHISGGSNGGEMMSVWFNSENKPNEWCFRTPDGKVYDQEQNEIIYNC
jgi:hypothetical protein